jgi:hypothetical protein
MSKALKTCLIVFLMDFVSSYPELLALPAQGEIAVGGYQQTENYIDDAGQAQSGAAQAGFGKFYLFVPQAASERLQFTADYRYRHDRYGRIQKNTLDYESTDSSYFKTLALKYTPQFYPGHVQLGRFAPVEGGTVIVDGMETAYYPSAPLRLGLLVGRNPRQQEGKAALQSTPHSLLSGIYGVLESDSTQPFPYHNVANMLIHENSEPTRAERLYFSHQTTYHPDSVQRLNFLFNYDIRPDAQLREAYGLYSTQPWPRLTSSVTVFRITAAEYEEKQDAREILPPSTYSQGGLDVKYRLEPQLTLLWSSFYGVRQYDGLTRQEIRAGISHSEVLMAALGMKAEGGYRLNFYSNDLFASVALSYQQNDWDLEIRDEYAIENRQNGSTYHPNTLGCNISYLVNNNLIATGALEHIADETTTIFGAVVRVSYKFGRSNTIKAPELNVPGGEAK